MISTALACALAPMLIGGTVGAQTDAEPSDASETAGQDSTAHDPWADSVLRWPDPLAASQLGTDAVYYWFSRADRRSLLPEPTAQRPLRIWAGGDSMSGGPVYGFRQLVGDDERFRFTEEIVVSSGVVTEWYFDWIGHMADEVAEGPYDVIVLAMGANDKQRFREHPDPVGSEAWSHRYQRRVREIVAAAARPGRLVVWVGLPPLGTDYLADLPGIVNPLAVAATADIAGTVFWDTFATMAVDGNYAQHLGPEHGDRAIRTSDGVHYTLYGGRLLTEPILAEIYRRSG
ncbi:DUF459 domain-containing protein [Candidatus Poriferisodalis sp.]|uniref:DUF459 domain-containing protein n=1 Tax=Candidatus Poriferisodalis sp. TaxID=3101277 RepID=UPI003B02DAA6